MLINNCLLIHDELVSICSAVSLAVASESACLAPDAPASQRWLWRNWGTTWPLRRVERLDSPADAWRVGFFSADWTPWPVVAMCRARWPALGFRLRVVYAAD